MSILRQGNFSESGDIGFVFGDDLMRKACWFGEPVFDRATECDFYCVFECALVSDGDEERFDIFPGSQDSAYCCAFIMQECISAFFQRRFLEGSGEPAFCASDSCFVEEESEMSSQAEPSWVSDSLAVNEEDIWCVFEFFYSFDADRGFAE